ncbi:MAG: class I SAM-dependent methyltransferase [Planctomycetota bacterium]|nr:class I SAM-dependent methyltransferase [Planctomycetota bacterium]
MSNQLKPQRTPAEAEAGCDTTYTTSLDYTDALEKAQFLADKYRAVLNGSVLDVGCGPRHLAEFVPKPDLYVGVDVKQPCDVVVDLDREQLPFEDKSFDVVTCCDVLEHLDSAHRMFDECCRVSRSRVIISLPNPVRDFLVRVFAGSGGVLTYYGFPPEDPGNRHRWFFGFEEAEAFVRAGAARNGFAVEQLDSVHDGCNYWLNAQGEDTLNHPNITRGQLWAILKREK